MIESEVGIPNPDICRDYELSRHVATIKREIEAFQPHCVIAASKGGRYLIDLWEDRNFDIPCVMLLG